MSTPIVTREVELDATTEEVWEAITDDDERATWFGGATEFELEPGGEGFATDPDGQRRAVRVDEVEPGRRLSFDWWPEGEDDTASRVELEVIPLEDGSRLRVTETFPATTPVMTVQAAAAAGPMSLLDLELRFLCRARV